MVDHARELNIAYPMVRFGSEGSDCIIDRRGGIRHRDWKVDKTLVQLHKRVSVLTDSGFEGHAPRPKNLRLKKRETRCL
jgi:hypothetical protein